MSPTRKIAGLLYIGIMFGAILWQTNIAPALGPDFVVPSGQRQLFLDDYGIGSMDGLTKTMHQPVKLGAVIHPEPGVVGGYQIRTAPFWVPEKDAFEFMVAETSGPTSIFQWYTSSSGISWTAGAQPNMGMYMVVYDGQDPNPNRRYKTVVPNSGVAVSPDGVHWSMVPGVPGISSSDEYNLSLDEENHQFLLTVKRGGPYGRSVALATSYDFEHWTDYGVVFHANAWDQTLGVQNIQDRLADPTLQQPIYNNPADYNVDVYNMGVFRYEGLYVGMPAMFHSTGAIPTGNTDGFHLIQLVSSRDLQNWKRLGKRQSFIGASPVAGGAFDIMQIIGPSEPVVRGDTLWFYYTGLKYRAGYDAPGADPDRGGICLAVLRRDGFISLDAGDQFGTLVTDQFVLSDEHLFVNLDAPTGAMYVQVFDEDEQMVAMSDLMTGNLLFSEVPWVLGSVADLLGEEVTLQFHLRDGSLYSYALGGLLGDANGDGLVDDLDLTALARHWQQAGGLAEGDFNDDGVIDDLDLTVLATAWPGVPTGSGDVSAVPEPATLAMMALLALSLPKRGSHALLRRKQTR